MTALERVGRVGVAVFAGVFLLARVAAAQDAGIGGLVKDATGGVLPGVTVTAASPVLIEQQRTAVTDGEGSLRHHPARPGVYTVTFSLSGFGTVVREGIRLSAGFTANVEGELRVGSVSETITVTGASPVVDVAECAAADGRDQRAARGAADQHARASARSRR